MKNHKYNIDNIEYNLEAYEIADRSSNFLAIRSQAVVTAEEFLCISIFRVEQIRQSAFFR